MAAPLGDGAARPVPANANRGKRRATCQEIEDERGEAWKEPTAKERRMLKKRRMQKEDFIYGNYRNYYRYRIDKDLTEDPRLAIFRKEWFEGKDCLDIGCNEGLITINIALKFQCRSLLGIDIDQGLINKAYRNLRKLQRVEISRKSSKQMSKPCPSSTAKTEISNEGSVKSMLDGNSSIDLSEVVSFECENFLESDNTDFVETYDTVLCLSVTKWVHLNWGDDGLIKLFVEIWKILKPGGLLLLEPQLWKSYKRNRGASEVSRMNYMSILLRPREFREVLLDKVGFKSVDVITNKMHGAVAGFDRPFFAFYK